MTVDYIKAIGETYKNPVIAHLEMVQHMIFKYVALYGLGTTVGWFDAETLKPIPPPESSKLAHFWMKCLTNFLVEYRYNCKCLGYTELDSVTTQHFINVFTREANFKRHRMEE